MKYAYSVICTRVTEMGQTNIMGNIGFVEAVSQDEATGKALHFVTEKTCPKSEGWRNHNAIVAPIDQACVEI